MGCSCSKRFEEPLPRHPRRRASLEIDRAALRHLMASRAEVVEAMAADLAGAAPKATGRPTANVGVLWKYYTHSVYKSGDLPAIATREALQNSLDSIVAAVRARQLPRGQGRFEVTLDMQARSLTFADNGVGMSTADILDRFLSLGSSGKSAAADSSEAAGGFGVAKAVILGTSGTFRWDLLTRDNRVVSHGEDRDIDIFQLDPPIQGMVLRIFDIPDQHIRWRWDRVLGEHRPLEARLRDVLGACDLDDVELRLNGAPVKRLFSRRGGSRLADGAAWGPGTIARVRGYRRPPGDRHGGYWIRLGGLFQFREPSRRGDLPADIVIDLTTTVRPGQPGYPLNAARDSLHGAAFDKWMDLVEQVERENESAAHSAEDEVFDPEGDAPDGDAAHALAELGAEVFDDPEFRRALGDASGGLLDLYAARGPLAGGAPTSTAPPSTRIVAQPVTSAGADAGTPEVIRAFLLDADARREAGAGAAEDEIPPFLSAPVQAALQAAEAGTLDAEGRQLLGATIGRVVVMAQAAGGGGLAQLGEVPRVVAALDAAAPHLAVKGSRARPRRPANPFGSLAGLRISKKNYDRARARRFKTGWKKWLPHLTAWDTTLRMIAAEAGIKRGFKPGFVLDDDLVGLASASPGKAAVIYLHPDRLAEAMKAHRTRPLAVAGFLHGVACHEFAHLDGRMGQGHNEGFVSAREELGRATAHLLPAIAIVVERLLNVSAGTSEHVRALVQLRSQVARLTSKAAESKENRQALARARRELETCQRQLDEGVALSTRTRAGMNAACGCGAKAGAGAAASHLPEVSLREALDAGNPHLVVYAIGGRLAKRPPPGVDRAYIEAFLQRNEDALVRSVAAALGGP